MSPFAPPRHFKSGVRPGAKNQSVLRILLFELSKFFKCTINKVNACNYRYAVAPYSTFKKLGIPGPAPWPFLGNLPDYNKKVIESN